MFLPTRNQTIIHPVTMIPVLLELREIGIENFQILSMVFSYLHVAFTMSLGHEDAATCCLCHCPEGNILCFRLPAPPFLNQLS